MRVLYSCLSKSWGGMEMFTLHAVKQLKSRQIEADLLCFPGTKLFNSAAAEGIKVLPASPGGYLNFTEIFKISKILSRGNYDLVHTQFSKDLWTLVPALKISGKDIPLILTKQVGSFIVKKDFLHRWIYSRVNYALAISEVIRTNLADTCPIEPSRILLLHNGIDTTRFDPEKVDGIKVRAEFGIKESELLVGMLARFSPGKGHEEFLYAAQKLSAEFPDVKFMIVGEPSRGEDEYAAKIKNLSQNMGLKDKVIFTGFRKDIPEVLAAMDIFAFPSHSEAFGIALAEAMAMGIPSVCTASDGVLDIAVNNQTSFLFEKQNASDFTDKLRQMILSPDKRKEFGINSRKRAAEKFDIEKLTDDVIDIYNKAIQKSQKKNK